MINIELFSKDIIWGNFRASDHGLIPASFSYNGTSEDALGMMLSTSEEFVGNSPVPAYLGDKYNGKLEFHVTIIKNPKIFHSHMFFTEKDCRWLLRELTGKKGYQWMKIIMNDLDEDMWYKAKIQNVSYERIGSRIAGLILEFECDSFFAWTPEKNITIRAKANQPFYIYNDSDDLTRYLYPIVFISPSNPGTLLITNVTDNQATEIKNVQKNETITIDSQKEIITSNVNHDLLLNDFNLCWPRLTSGKNEYVTNVNMVIILKYRLPRKVGIVD